MNVNRLLEAARRLWRALTDVRVALKADEGKSDEGKNGEDKNGEGKSGNGKSGDGKSGERWSDERKSLDAGDHRRVFREFADGLGQALDRPAGAKRAGL